ncbi:14289_t:CDS:2 [Dentiscutata erythropus]|uniref:14289_t:CDS:1 n=1 Tax=Dentiscutata erythropus TaxID=1348616 RepID=A0A9N9BJ89_9GLOM|nr:14289_t:CDS:2 [Dentiscutata erythropus]
MLHQNILLKYITAIGIRKNEIVELVLNSLISSNSINETLLEKELQKLDGEPNKDKIKEIFNHVFESLNKEIVKKQEGYEFEGIVGTTATIALIFNKTTYVVHRGDSPAYVGYKKVEDPHVFRNSIRDRPKYWLDNNTGREKLLEDILGLEVWKVFSEILLRDLGEITKDACFLMGKKQQFFRDEEEDDTNL